MREVKIKPASGECYCCGENNDKDVFSVSFQFGTAVMNNLKLCRRCLGETMNDIREGLRGHLEAPMYAIVHLQENKFSPVVLECSHCRYMEGKVVLTPAKQSGPNVSCLTYNQVDEGRWFFHTKEAAEARLAELNAFIK